MSEPSEEKKTKLNEYANACAQLGETILSVEIAQATISELKEKAKTLLSEIKGME